MRKKWCGILFILVFLPLCSESLRDQSKAYFNTIQWEELNNDLVIPPVSEPYMIEGSRPISYADTINEGDILPSLPQLGVLDYQNIPEDLLNFCDMIAVAIVTQSIDAALFSTQKAFLPHLGCFMFEHFPNFSYAFYGRPSFKQDGSAIILLRLAVRSAAVEDHDTSGTFTQHDDAMQQTTVVQQDMVAHSAETDQPYLSTEAAENFEGTKDTEEGVQAQTENISDVPNLFSGNEQPLFIILELGAVKEDTIWKISYIDFKGAEYEDSALKD